MLKESDFPKCELFWGMPRISQLRSRQIKPDIRNSDGPVICQLMGTPHCTNFQQRATAAYARPNFMAETDPRYRHLVQEQLSPDAQAVLSRISAALKSKWKGDTITDADASAPVIRSLFDELMLSYQVCSLFNDSAL